ncbi:MAG TPA: hypothetical protein VFG30_03585 [Polyangiales bacterium]|nr:hypothetical protein [Polyangiales bacterium]
MLVRDDLNDEALSNDLQPGAAAKRGIRDRVLALLQTRAGGLIVAVVAFLLCAPALRTGFQTDDHVHRTNAQLGFDPVAMFEISPARATSLRSLGQLAWWSSPELSVKFLRPLAAVTHFAEFQLWPNAAWAMHLTSNLLYAALVWVAWLLYRELLPLRPRWAALAALMFAIDDGHAPTIGWISGRNTLLASLFALTALLLHVHSRKYATSARVSQALSKQLRLHGASAACVALALLSAEAGVAVFAYLIAYALAFEAGSIRDRAITLAPQLVVFVCWAVIYLAGGFGAHGTSFYRDLSQPFFVLAQGILDLPTWLVSLFGLSEVGAAMVLPPAPVRVVALVVCVPLLYGLVVALPRTRANVFFAVGALLCLPPLFTTQPQDRLLISASFGAFALIASLIATAAASASRFARGTRYALIGLHLVLPVLLFVPTLGQGMPIENGARDIAAQVREHPASQVVFVNLPIELLSLYAWSIVGERSGDAAPKAMQQLYAGWSPMQVARIDANTLEVTVAQGWGERVAERVFCGLDDLPRKDSKLSFESMRTWVVDSDAAGHPVKVQFKFPDALESPARLWLSWEGTKPVPWKPPAIGQSVSLPPLNMFTSLKM